VLIITLAMLALLLAVAPVSAGAIVTREEVEVTIDDIFSAPCPDVEDIHVQGTYIIKTKTVLDGHGGFHFSTHWNWAKFTGTGLTSGDSYIVNQNHSQTEHDLSGMNGVENFTLIFSFHLVSKGSGENIHIKGVNHHTINANGETTVDKATFSVVCK
jgi:hypothetical protein